MRNASPGKWIPWGLAALLLSGPALGQLVIPDRLPDGSRMAPFVTPQEMGQLPFDTLRTMPAAVDSRNDGQSWWRRHALFLDGPVRVALDPVVDYRLERSRFDAPGLPPALETPRRGFRNIRGVRYAGDIDRKVAFGGTVLEMQRTLVGPDAVWTLEAEAYPGMGPGKLRPGEGGLHTLDHSLAQVWFNAPIGHRIRAQWGLGSVGLGPGTRNLLCNPGTAPAPYLLLEADLGHGWTYRWVQQRQRGRERLPADGAREGRYVPLGLGVRTIGKTFQWRRHSLELTLLSARWSSVMDRGATRPSWLDWTLHLAPWPLLPHADAAPEIHLAGHQGIDLQWRRPLSTWYGQVRTAPFSDPRYVALRAEEKVPDAHILFGHVRHGERTSLWIEYAPLMPGLPAELDPAPLGGSLGIRSLSAFQPDWVVGAEWRPAGWTLAAEWGRLEQGNWSAKSRLTLPAAAIDATSDQRRRSRSRMLPNRLLPPFVPIGFHLEFGTWNGSPEHTWWSIGLASSIIPVRKAY